MGVPHSIHVVISLLVSLGIVLQYLHLVIECHAGSCKCLCEGREIMKIVVLHIGDPTASPGSNKTKVLYRAGQVLVCILEGQKTPLGWLMCLHDNRCCGKILGMVDFTIARFFVSVENRHCEWGLAVAYSLCLLKKHEGWAKCALLWWSWGWVKQLAEQTFPPNSAIRLHNYLKSMTRLGPLSVKRKIYSADFL